MADCDPRELISAAKLGDARMLNELIKRYRPYLRLLARLQRDPRLNAKFEDSDMVQEVSALAAKHFADFRGSTEPEFAAWLRVNMARVASQSLRHFTRQRRDIQLEQELQRTYDQSSVLLATGFAQKREISPSENAMRREQAVLIAEALDCLPEHYREIIVLRDFEGLTFGEVGNRVNRSADSARKMWARGVVMLREALEDKL